PRAGAPGRRPGARAVEVRRRPRPRVSRADRRPCRGAARRAGPLRPGARPMSAARQRRRGWVVATLVVGAALLAFTLGLEPGNDLFLVAGFAMAAVWAGGALLSGPMPVGHS